MKTTTNTATPQNTTGSKQGHDPAVTTIEFITAKTQLHKQQHLPKLFQQVRAKPLKNKLCHIKVPEEKKLRPPGARWPLPGTE